MNCFLCHSSETTPAPFVTVPPYSQWVVCHACGSHTALREYDPAHYVEGLDTVMLNDTGGIAVAREQVRTNADWFDKFANPDIGRDFLDVGCGDGAMLRVMADRGWAVHGWDVFRPQYFGSHVTVSRTFTAAQFPRQYAAINCREVIEHCPGPRTLLREMCAACLPGGLIQIQTPSPIDHFHPNTHTYGHLFIASSAALKAMILEAGLTVLDEMSWVDGRQAGQAYICAAGRSS